MKHIFKKQLIAGAIILLVLTFNCFAAHSFTGKYISVESSNDGAGKFTYSVSDGTATGFLGGNTNIFRLVFPVRGVFNVSSPDDWVSEFTDEGVVFSCTNPATWFLPSAAFPLIFSVESSMIVSNMTGYVSGELYTNETAALRAFGTTLVPTVNIAGIEEFSMEGAAIPEPISALCLLFSVIYFLFFYRKNLLNCKLQIANCKSQIKNRKFQISNFKSQILIFLLAFASFSYADLQVGNGEGFVANYFNDTEMNQLAYSEISMPNQNWGTGSPDSSVPNNNFSARWTGSIQAQSSENYTFYIQTGSDEGVRLIIDTADREQPTGRKSNVLIDTWNSPTSAEQSGTIEFKKGETYDVVIEYKEGTGTASISFKWEAGSISKEVVPVSQTYKRPTYATAVLSDNWIVEKIGAATANSSFISEEPMFEITGGGTGLAGAADQCTFAYRDFCGFAEIIVKVKDFAPVAGPTARTGIMMRENSDADSRFIAIVTKPDGGMTFIKRTTTGGASTSTEVSPGAFIKLYRNGPTICAYVSESGLEDDWTFVGRADFMENSEFISDWMQLGVVTFSGESAVANASNLTRVYARAIIPMGGNVSWKKDYFIDAFGFNTFEYSTTSTNMPGFEGEILSMHKDASGWPTCDFSWKSSPQEKGIYKLKFYGQADISTKGTIITQIYNAAENLTTMEINFPGGSLGAMNFYNTIRENGGAINTGLTGIRMVKPGYELDSNLLTHEALRYIKISTVGPLRNFGFLPSSCNWDDRTPPDSPTWMTASGDAKIPLEILIQVCNEVKRDLWINMPASGVDQETGPDDDFVNSLANVIANGTTVNGRHYPGLSPDLNVYVEWANESWNGIFQGSWRALNGMQDALDAGTTFGTAGLTLDYDGKTPEGNWDGLGGVLQYRWIGARIKRFSDIFLKPENFGATARKVRVRTTLAGNNGSFINSVQAALDFVKAAWPNTEDDVFFAASGVGYFGSGLLALGGGGAGPNENLTVPELVEDFYDGVREDRNYYNSAIAKIHGLYLVEYEGGPSCNVPEAGQLSPGFEKTIYYGFNKFFDKGGMIINQYKLGSGNYGGQYGDWNIGQQYDLTQPRGRAFMNLINAKKTSQVTAGFTELPQGELLARYYLNHGIQSKWNETEWIGNSSHDYNSWSSTFRHYLLRVPKPMTVEMKLRAGTLLSGLEVPVYLNKNAPINISIPQSTNNPYAGNKVPVFLDTDIVTLQLKAGLNSIMLDLPTTSNSSELLIYSMKFRKPGGSFSNGKPWIYNVVNRNQTLFYAGDEETPSDSLTISGVSDNETLLSNSNISVTYNASKKRYDVSMPKNPGVGKVNVTWTVSDSDSQEQKYISKITYKPDRVHSLTNYNIPSGVKIEWQFDEPENNPVFNVLRTQKNEGDKPDSGYWYHNKVDLGTTGVNVTNFIDKTIVSGNRYYYAVRAVVDGVAGLQTSPNNCIPVTIPDGFEPPENIGIGTPNFFTGKGVHWVKGPDWISTNSAQGATDGQLSTKTGISTKGARLVVAGIDSGGENIDNIRFYINALGALSFYHRPWDYWHQNLPAWVKIYYSSDDQTSIDTSDYTYKDEYDLYSLYNDYFRGLHYQNEKGGGQEMLFASVADLNLPADTKSILLEFPATPTAAAIVEMQAFPDEAASPAAPTGLDFSAWSETIDPENFINPVAGIVNLSWNLPSEKSLFFEIERDVVPDFSNPVCEIPKKTNKGIEYPAHHQAWFTLCNVTNNLAKFHRPNLPYNVNSRYWNIFNDSLKPGSNYFFRIRSVNSAGNVSDWVNFNSGNSINIPDYSPSISTPSISATVIDSGHIQLNWTSVSGAKYYKIDQAFTPSMIGDYKTGRTSMYQPIILTNGNSFVVDSCKPDKTYYFRVRAVGTNAAGENVDSIGDVVEAVTPSAPSPPPSISAVGDDGVIKIQWDYPTSCGIDHYALYRSETSGGQVSSNPYAIVHVGIKFMDTNVVPGVTYFYKVAGIRSDRDFRDSDSDPTTTLSTETSAHAKRVLKIVAPIASDDNPTTDGNAGLSVLADKYGSDSGLTYSWSLLDAPGTANFSPDGNNAAKNTTADSFSVNNASYKIQSAVSDGRLAVYSTIIQEVGDDTTPPAAPTSVSATAGDWLVDIDWADNSESDFAGYNIYRSESSGSGFVKINDSLLTASDFTDENATNGFTWYYIVTAVDGAGNESDDSNEVFASPQNVLPDVPTSLIALAGAAKVSLNWHDNSEVDLAGYNIYRSLSSGGTYSKINSALVVVSLYIDETVSNGTEYFYKVSAVDDQSGESPKTDFVSAIPGSDTNAPAYPTGMDVESGDSEISVDWHNNTELDIAGYNLYRSTLPTPDSSYSKINSSLIIPSFYRDTTVTNEITYYYKASAVDESGNESPLAKDYAYTAAHDAPPAKPENFTAVAANSKVVLNWDDNIEVDLVGYRLYRATDSAGPFSVVANTNILTKFVSEFTDTNVISKTKYWYYAVAVDIFNHESSKSSIRTVTPFDTIPPAAPTGLSAELIFLDEQILLNWNANSEPDMKGYRAYHSVNPTSGFSEISGSSLLTNTTFAHDGYEFEKTNYYYVTAVDFDSNESSNSVIAECFVFGDFVLPMSEQFSDYSLGDLKDQHNSDDKYWSRIGSNTNNPLQVTAGSLYVPQIPYERGNKVSVTGNSNGQNLRFNPLLPLPYIDLLSSPAYVSAAVRVNAISNSPNGYVYPLAMYRGNNYSLLLIRQSETISNHYNLGVKHWLYGGTAVFATNEFEMGSTQWVVLKCSLPNGTNSGANFNYDIFVNPPAENEPTNSDASTSFAYSGSTRISSLMLCSTHSKSGGQWADFDIDLDELILNNDWPGKSIDADGDGATNFEEDEAGTNPNDPVSVFQVLKTKKVDDGIEIYWKSSYNRVYNVLWSPDFESGFDILTNDLPATPPLNIFNDTEHNTQPGLYRIEVKKN